MKLYCLYRILQGARPILLILSELKSLFRPTLMTRVTLLLGFVRLLRYC